MRDYDILVASVLDGFPEELTHEEIRPHLSVAALVALLRHGGSVFILGDPRFSIRNSHAVSYVSPFLEWTGLTIRWENGSGTQLTIVENPDSDRVLPYLRLIQKWDYYIEDVSVNAIGYATALGEYHRGSPTHVTEALTTLVKTRFDKPVAATCVISHGASKLKKPLNPIFLLPPCRLNPTDALNAFLESVFRISLGKEEEPDWLSQKIAFGQRDVDKKATEAQSRLVKEQTALQELNTQRTELRKTLSILYSSGPQLESITLEVLRQLGGRVELPQTPGNEDGIVYVKVGGREEAAVLEIKGTAKDALDEEAIKQINIWYTQAVIAHDRDFKKLIVASNALDRAPSERPYPFSRSWEDRCKRLGISVITASDLYRALYLTKSGTLSPGEFLGEALASTGIYDGKRLKKQFEKLTDEMEDPFR